MKLFWICVTSSGLQNKFLKNFSPTFYFLYQYRPLSLNHSISSEDVPGGSDGKGSVYNAGDPGLIPGSGRSPGEWNGNSLQYSCLENPTNRGAWWAIVHGVAKSQTWLSDQHTHTMNFAVMPMREINLWVFLPVMSLLYFGIKIMLIS